MIRLLTLTVYSLSVKDLTVTTVLEIDLIVAQLCILSFLFCLFNYF